MLDAALIDYRFETKKGFRLRGIEPVEGSKIRLHLVANCPPHEFCYCIYALHGGGSVVWIETEAGQKLVLLVLRPVVAILPCLDTAGPDRFVAAIGSFH